MKALTVVDINNSVLDDSGEESQLSQQRVAFSSDIKHWRLMLSDINCWTLKLA